MRISTFKCDYCDTQKGTTNHWWLRQVKYPGFLLIPWTTDLAYEDSYEHICSQSCASKALSQYLSRANSDAHNSVAADCFQGTLAPKVVITV